MKIGWILTLEAMMQMDVNITLAIFVNGRQDSSLHSKDIRKGCTHRLPPMIKLSAMKVNTNKQLGHPLMFMRTISIQTYQRKDRLLPTNAIEKNVNQLTTMKQT